MSIHETRRLIAIAEALLMTSMSRSAWYDHLNPSSPRYDPDLPRPVKLGKTSVRWVRQEVVEYLDKLVQRRGDRP